MTTRIQRKFFAGTNYEACSKNVCNSLQKLAANLIYINKPQHCME